MSIYVKFCYRIQHFCYTAIYDPKLEKTEIPFFAIPLWAIIWGATGSLAAILYRFYTVKKRVNFFQESQWLIARPLIGILMSAIAYLTVQAGLIVVGNNSTDSATLSDNSRRVTSIICFLAGFSDRVYLSLIDLLIERTFGSQVENNEGTGNGNNNLGQTLAPVITDNQTMTIGQLEQRSPEQKENTSLASGLNSDSIFAQSPQSDETKSEDSVLE